MQFDESLLIEYRYENSTQVKKLDIAGTPEASPAPLFMTAPQGYMQEFSDLALLVFGARYFLVTDCT